MKEQAVDLDLLEQEFDELIAGMQSSDQRNAVDALFHMTAMELGQAAVARATGTG